MTTAINSLYTKLTASITGKTVVITLRLIVGAVFIVSGFVKAIDPMGSVYKFQEYFNALSLDTLAGSEVFLAFAVPALELTLGVMLLTGCLRRTTPLLLLLMMAVMLPLTFYLATTNAIADCGCFGDAFKISNWATFWKNVAVTIALLYLVATNRSVPSVYGPAIQWIVMLLTFLLAMAIAFTGYTLQPLIDFMPYKVGTKISPAIAPTTQDDFVFVYEKDGERREFSIDSVPDDDQGWEFVERRKTTPELSPAQKAELSSISVFENGVDVTEEVLDSTKNLMILVVPDMNLVNRAYAFVINDLAKRCKEKGAEMVAFVAADQQQIEDWIGLTEPQYPIYTADDTQLKMLARGNPAIAYVENGVISWKRTFASLPARELLTTNVPLSQLSNDLTPDIRLWELLTPYILIMIALLFVNRTYPVVAFIARKSRKNKNKD